MKVSGMGVAVAVLVAAVAAWLWFRPANKQPTAPNTPAIVPTNPPVAMTAIPARATGLGLHAAAAALSRARTTKEKQDALISLRHATATGSTHEIVTAIRQLLDSGTDASTGLGFKIGGGGALLEAPTLRTFLLDQLGALDPAAAAAYAREILNTSNSPDEWALALRNLARGDTSAEARTMLEAKTGELLRNEAWQRDPSVGYLEAFDTAVHLGGTTLLPPLTELVSKKDNQAVAHAAFLTLDRLTINQPAQTLAALNEHPDWMTGHEATRANYFARADIGDATQRQLVESYLLDSTRSPAELQTFVGVFPNANFMISHNLLTENVTLGGAT